MKQLQKDVFRASEGDAWHARNRSTTDDLATRLRNDPVLAAFRALGVVPKRALEIGCGNGYRLEGLRTLHGTECFGIEPSPQAVAEAHVRFPSVSVEVGTADELPFADDRFDAVVFGFCLYLCDRRDLFAIVAEADRVLADGGYVVVYDFFSPGVPYRNPYVHHTGLYSYKMDHAALFLGNPAYTRVHHAVVPTAEGGAPLDPNERVAVTMLQKNLAAAYPDNPYRDRSKA